jgi:hypothetical protein
MPITILDYVKSRAGEKDSYSAADFHSNGVEMLGGCEICHATIACYNAYPSTSGYWRCADCIGDIGFATVDDFTRHETETGTAIGWLLRLRQLQADGMDFDAALAQANAEYDEPADYPASGCPCCGAVEHIRDVGDHNLECCNCGAVWTQ